ncbi:MAG: Rieske 2Fe-2S domain-containing protein [Proteobacteria bacterium]|nr:Rieske 2Fe-2S domain-containing protein [Pseudomonadota bacterium]
MSEMHFQRVARAADVLEGSMLPVQLSDRRIVLCHTRSGWYALDDVCTHADANLHEGRLRGTKLICPLHGAAFDCRSGAVLSKPATVALCTYEVRCVGEEVQVALPKS